jgi:hypothetical protein
MKMAPSLFDLHEFVLSSRSTPVMAQLLVSMLELTQAASISVFAGNFGLQQCNTCPPE